MSDSEPPLSIEIAVPHDAWTQTCPDAEVLTSAAALLAFAAVGRFPAGTETIVLGVTLTDDSEQRRLNRTYRGKDAPTNVLAFSIADPSMAVPDGAPILLGDIILAFETVRREADEQGKSLPQHLQHLVVHGVLHLLGYDHQSAEEAEEMERLEIAVLARLGVPDPYCAII